MKSMLVAGTAIFAAFTLQAQTYSRADVNRAIAYERAKDRAAARQLQKERGKPAKSQTSADRSTPAQPETGQKVTDPGPTPAKK